MPNVDYGPSSSHQGVLPSVVTASLLRKVVLSPLVFVGNLKLGESNIDESLPR